MTDIASNGTTVKNSVNNRKQNKKTLTILLLTIAVLLTISVVYIIIYPTL
jgi:hypothetical protein